MNLDNVTNTHETLKQHRLQHIQDLISRFAQISY